MKKSLVFLFASSFLYAMENKSPLADCMDKKYDDVCFAHAHDVNGNSTNSPDRPSVVSDQDIPFAELMRFGVRCAKTPVHYQTDNGNGHGTGTIASHGIYRETLYQNYYPAVTQTVTEMNQWLKRRTILLKLFGWIQVPGLYTKLRDLPQLIDTYNRGIQPIFGLIDNAFPVAYGSSTRAAQIPYNPNVIDPNARQFTAVLQEIKDFLDHNPNDIFTLKIEKKASLDDIARDFTTVGLDTYAHIQQKDQDWPTLQEMVDCGKRLVILITDSSAAQYPWILQESDFMWSTPYSFSSKEALAHDLSLPENDPNFRRRLDSPHNTLFELPHFLTIGFAGLPGAADQVNEKSFLLKRVKALAKRAGVIPNYIDTDFTQHGDVLDVVNRINARCVSKTDVVHI